MFFYIYVQQVVWSWFFKLYGPCSNEHLCSTPFPISHVELEIKAPFFLHLRWEKDLVTIWGNTLAGWTSMSSVWTLVKLYRCVSWYESQYQQHEAMDSTCLMSTVQAGGGDFFCYGYFHCAKASCHESKVVSNWFHEHDCDLPQLWIQ